MIDNDQKKSNLIEKVEINQLFLIKLKIFDLFMDIKVFLIF